MPTDLKCWPEYFWPLKEQLRRTEVRKNDRYPGFQVGDRLRFREWVPPRRGHRVGRYTGHECYRVVIFITDLEPIGFPGWVALDLAT